MFLQGDLQVVFDALYTIGAIDPVLKMDWKQVSEEMDQFPQRVYQACQQINECGGNHQMIIQKLSTMDSDSVHFVALEVAREFCEFQDRSNLH